MTRDETIKLLNQLKKDLRKLKTVFLLAGGISLFTPQMGNVAYASHTESDMAEDISLLYLTNDELIELFQLENIKDVVKNNPNDFKDYSRAVFGKNYTQMPEETEKLVQKVFLDGFVFSKDSKIVNSRAVERIKELTITYVKNISTVKFEQVIDQNNKEVNTLTVGKNVKLSDIYKAVYGFLLDDYNKTNYFRTYFVDGALVSKELYEKSNSKNKEMKNISVKPFYDSYIKMYIMEQFDDPTMYQGKDLDELNILYKIYEKDDIDGKKYINNAITDAEKPINRLYEKLMISTDTEKISFFESYNNLNLTKGTASYNQALFDLAVHNANMYSKNQGKSTLPLNIEMGTYVLTQGITNWDGIKTSEMEKYNSYKTLANNKDYLKKYDIDKSGKELQYRYNSSDYSIELRTVQTTSDNNKVVRSYAVTDKLTAKKVWEITKETATKLGKTISEKYNKFLEDHPDLIEDAKKLWNDYGKQYYDKAIDYADQKGEEWENSEWYKNLREKAKDAGENWRSRK